MELQQIAGFYQVVRLGSFTRAAEATARTQSALSQQVKALERELGRLLIERIGRGKLLLTPFGREVYRFAEEILAKQQHLLETLEEMKGSGFGKLVVAAAFTTLYQLLPKKIASYTREFPGVQLTILDRPQRETLRLVREGEVDVGIAQESAVPPELEAVSWKRIETVLLVPKGHPLTGKRHVSLEDIVQYPLILRPRFGRNNREGGVEKLFRDSGLSYRVILESSNVELSSVYVEQGIGLAFASMVGDSSILHGRALEQISLSRYMPDDRLALVSHKKRRLTACQRAFIDLCLEEELS
jgi:DNA-binding transcriptional LysR family regulator